MAYTGTTPKDLDLTTPDGATEYLNIIDDAVRELKKVFKYSQAINTVTDDTTLDATHSWILANKASAIAITLPGASTIASSTFTKEYRIKNIGAGTCTIAGTVTLNGTATVNPTLAQYDEIYIWTNGSTFYGMKFSSTAVANSVAVRNTAGNLPFRGAIVYNNSSVVSGATVSWSSEAYDSDSIHESVTNPSRLTVPTGVIKVRLTAQIDVTGSSAALDIQKNGSSSYIGRTQLVETPSLYTPYISPVLSVSGGDYFTIKNNGSGSVAADTTGYINWFAMEIIE